MLYDLVRVLTTTVGAGTLTLGTAEPGYLTFAQAGVADGATVSYGIRDGVQSEVGRGVYSASAGTLTRVVSSSTNGGAALNLSGAASVYITALAADILTPDAADAAYAALVHNHSAAAITSGTLSAARLPDLSGTYAALVHGHAAEDVTSGVLAAGRVPWGTPGAIGATTPAAGAFTELTAATPPPAEGPNLVINGTFANSNNWSLGAGWSVSGGAAIKVPGTASSLAQSGFAANRLYRVRFSFSSSAGTFRVRIANTLITFTYSGSGTSDRFVTTLQGGSLSFDASDTFAGSISNVVVNEWTPSANAALNIGYAGTQKVHFNTNDAGMIALGLGAGRLVQTGSILIGTNAGEYATGGNPSVIIGHNTMRYGYAASSNVAIGNGLAPNASNDNLILIGSGCNVLNNQSFNMVAIGSSMLQGVTNNRDCVYIGSGVIQSGTGGFSNVVVGTNGAMQLASGINTIIGSFAGTTPAGLNTPTTTAGGQTLIGFRAGQATATQRAFMTVIGANALGDAANTVFLGRVTDAVASGLLIPLSEAKTHWVHPTTGSLSSVANSFVWGRDDTAAGTAAAGYGFAWLAQLRSSTTSGRDAARIVVGWADATDATRSGDLTLSAYNATTEREGLRVRGGSAGAQIGFLGATPVARQTGGSATAGGTWTSNEQGMMQRMYDALRAYGLLT